MEQPTKEQRFRQALAEYAAQEVSESRDVWPGLYRKLKQRRGTEHQVLNLTAAPTQPRWNFVAGAAMVILLVGLLSLVLPATLGQYTNHTIISPTSTYAATDTATVVVGTTTPLPQSGSRVHLSTSVVAEQYSPHTSRFDNAGSPTPLPEWIKP